MTHPESTLTHAGAIDSPAARRLQQILDILPQPVMLFRPDGQVEYANAAARQQFGEPLAAVSCHHYTLASDRPCHGEQPCPFQLARDSGQPVTLEHCRRDAHGNERFIEVTAAPLFGEDGRLEALLETHHDVTARKQEEQRLQLLQGQLTELAHRDPLTNLSNRRFLELKLEALARDRVSRHCALLFADLDQFKPINDVHGHVIGDRVLSLVAQRLRSAVRNNDLLVRVGGDEFAILLENSNDSGARAVASKIIAALSLPLDGLPTPNQLGVSIGIAMFSTGSAMPAELLQHADAAMYCAKRRGGNDRELVRL
ncbi:sensor domain-containing diguanylate cyclase [Vogesella facilis]|uniref:Sensor domain-containing diguanylate cyclase n=1 Tax=Vogesella facilis TaxID=1655232 RepID=A0ABV7RB19_9NEIS